MPRLSWRLLYKAWKEHPLLPSLLRPCRDLRSARLELKWLESHAREVASERNEDSTERLLNRHCFERSRGTPLQYILGTEFFGELELKCVPGVLIPRQETATYVTHLLDLLKRNAARLPSQLRVLDLCTGSGCISLLFAHAFPDRMPNISSLQILGVDVSKNAIRLANHNKRDQMALFPKSFIKDVSFLRADILSADSSTQSLPLINVLRSKGLLQWDILISNPPYISPTHFNQVTARSVRNFEPRLALVPDTAGQHMSDDDQADLFYPKLLDIAKMLDVKVLLMEVGDLSQAGRIANFARRTGCWDGVEIWLDEPGVVIEHEIKSQCVPTRGIGNGRSILCWKAPADEWLGRAFI